ncbi:MAG TPA: ATP-binding protein [Candidatus Eisenbacteria bacterium]|nr:ATP-binding protein [Candidatus Eisenbacteria bacterium]
MRLSVASRIIAGLSLIFLIGISAIFVIYNGLVSVEKALQQLADVRGPISAATHEMEINVNGIALGVLKYLDSRDEQYRKLAQKDQKDFEVFYGRYVQLAGTERERQLAQSINDLYNEYRALGETLMNTRDRQDAIFSTVAKTLEDLDRIIDTEIEPKLDLSISDAIAKVRSLGSLEADLAEIGIWLANYQRLRNPEFKALISRNEQEFRAGLAQFKALDLSQSEKRWLGAVERRFSPMMLSVEKVVALEDDLQVQSKRFIDLRSKMDDILDREMQMLAQEYLYRPRKQVDDAVAAVIQRIHWLVAFFFLSGVTLAILLIRAITKPVRNLIQGTEAVSRGDLAHRIRRTSADELGDLANHFNAMVAQLEATTVSKELLEASERSLKATVVSLRGEMEERERLQASLRRSEMMAAMGSLVAGVAHEVRNPLFAISSTLDAIENRFADRKEYAAYLRVMRAEVNRLSGLMQALLEYGKPSGQRFVPALIGPVVQRAARACEPLARLSNVTISLFDDGKRARVRMDRERLAQVFQNLIENAIQHSPRGATVAIDARESVEDGQRWIDYEVKDSGPGFAEADLPRIFEPFFSRRRGGTGLGLSIVQRIVEDHGGKIRAQNRFGGGALMIVRLPAESDTAESEKDAEVHSATKQDPSHRG